MTVAAIGCVGLAAARTAQAQSASGGEVQYDVQVEYTVKQPDPANPKTKGEAPQIEATVIGAPNLPADKFILVDRSARSPVQIKAVSRRSYSQGAEPIAIAVVMLGWEMWIGNDTYRGKKDPTRAAGVLPPLKAALDKLDLPSAAPAGSLGMLITYADTARIRVPMGPLGNLNGGALGTQEDYQGTVGFDLVKGIDLALAELRKVATPRKMLIVITDGTDQSGDKAKEPLQRLKKQANNDRVVMRAFVYKAKDSGPANLMTGWIPSWNVTTADTIGTSLQVVRQLVDDRQYLTFPGFDKSTKVGLTWDGKVHDLLIMVDGQEADLSWVGLPKWSPPPMQLPKWAPVGR